MAAARMAARRGHQDEARRHLRSAVGADPGCAEGWLGLAWLARSSGEREALLRRVLSLDPGHLQAQAELARLERAAQEPASVGLRLPTWFWVTAVVLAILAAGTLLALGPAKASLARLLPTATPTPPPTPTPAPREVARRFEPLLQETLAEKQWERALELVAILQSLDPSGESVRRWSLAAYMQVGQAFVEDRQADQALRHFQHALALAPLDVEVRLWLATTQSYLAAQQAVRGGHWDVAVSTLDLVLGQIPGYTGASELRLVAYRGKAQEAADSSDWNLAIEVLLKVREQAPDDALVPALLQQCYRQRGIAYEEAAQGKTKRADQKAELRKAQADLEEALRLAPADAEAKAHLDRVLALLFPPKRIEIDISHQRMYVYEGDELIWTFVISTGLPGRDTAAGHFKVLDKIPMAYSQIWRLKMPHWLGIYYVGGVENGIHALPIRPDGSVMWGGLLGQRASYGCVILDNKAAKALYEWAEIGTPVDIHY